MSPLAVGLTDYNLQQHTPLRSIRLPAGLKKTRKYCLELCPTQCCLEKDTKIENSSLT